MKIIQTYSDAQNTAQSFLIGQRTMAMARDGHHVCALVNSSSRLAELFKRHPDMITTLTSGFAFGSSLSLPIKLQRLFDSPDSDNRTVVHCPDIQLADKALLARKSNAANIKVILELSTGVPPVSSAVNRHVLSSVDAVVLPSQTDADMLLGSGAWVNSDRVHVIAPGVVLPEIIVPDDNDDDKPEDEERDDEMTVVWADSILPGCGLDTIVEALGYMHRKRIRLIVAGQGPGRYAMPIIKRSRSLGIADRIEWLGNAVPDHNLLSKADVGLISAPHSPQALSAAAIFMSAGIPVIWADGSLAREIVMDDVDGMHAGHTVDDWCEIIGMLFSDPALRSQLGRDARAKAEAQYSMSRHTDSLTRLYLTLKS